MSSTNGCVTDRCAELSRNIKARNSTRFSPYVNDRGYLAFCLLHLVQACCIHQRKVIVETMSAVTLMVFEDALQFPNLP